MHWQLMHTVLQQWGQHAHHMPRLAHHVSKLAHNMRHVTRFNWKKG